jgi:formyltetrahydrofolate deformylase
MTSAPQKKSYILTLSCQDVPGIVAGVAGFVTEHEGFILESAQFGDASTDRFFLRMEFERPVSALAEDAFKKKFHDKVGGPFNMRWAIHRSDYKSRLLLMVSKFGHCLYDLLHRYHTGSLAVEIPAIISNHPDLEEVANWHNIPFYYLPLEKGKKAEQEEKVMEIVERHNIDLVVLARYMQILSPELCAQLKGRAINIHHSFLPSFKGAKPYHQAYERGVKLMGATAHYVTTDLDEGPIIEQEVSRVEHNMKPNDLAAAGRDVESQVLARAVRYHIENRVLLNGTKTVVFN